MKAAISLAILLAACGRQAPPPANEAETFANDARPAEPAARPFAYDEENDLLEFHFGWSAEAAAVPQLIEQFRREMDMEKEGLLKVAKADKAMRDEQGWPYHRLSRSTVYKTSGQSERVLILEVEHASFTGGAHGNYGSSTMFWDRAEAREIGLGDLFTTIDNMDRLLTQRWCDALNQAREERRGEPVGGSGMFDECPKLSEVATLPTDKDRNGKFDRILLVADPYVAGPYSEGSYEIELPMTTDLIAAVASVYRASFEVQPQ